MPSFESKLGGTITITRETYDDRVPKFRKATLQRAAYVRKYLESPTEENHHQYTESLNREIDLMVYPLAISVRFLGTKVPLGQIFFAPTWFIQEQDKQSLLLD